MAPDLLCGLFNLVFGPLYSTHHRLVAAGDKQQEPLARPAERWHQLGAILDRKATGGPRSCVYEPATSFEPLFDAQSSAFNLRQCGSYRGHGRELPADHRFEDV
jgi:hypothetical protein